MPGQVVFKGAFKASANDGTVYVIDMFEILDERSAFPALGQLLYRTAEGEAIKRIRSGVYEIEESGLIVRSLS
jgi:hypothetical protein